MTAGRFCSLALGGLGLVALAPTGCSDELPTECQMDLQCPMGSACVTGSCVVRLAQPATWSVEVTPEPQATLAAREWPDFAFGREPAMLLVDRKVGMATTITRAYADAGMSMSASSVHLLLGVASRVPGRRDLQFEADAANAGLNTPYETTLSVPERLLGTSARLWVAPQGALARTMCPWQFAVQVEPKRTLTLPGLDDTLVLEGVLQTAEGAGVADYEARVVLGERLVSSLARTDASGKFALRLHRSLVMQTMAPLPVELGPADAAQPRPKLLVEAPPGVTSLGTVRLPAHPPAVPVVVPVTDQLTGAPVAGATVRLEASLPGAMGGAARYVRSAPTGPDGRATLSVIPGTAASLVSYLMKVVPPSGAETGARCLPGYAIGAPGSDGTVVGPAATLPRKLVLSGTVTRSDGKPAAAVRVRATPRGGAFKEECLGDLTSPPAESRSDAQGRYRLLLDAGEYRLDYEPEVGAPLPLHAEESVSVTADASRTVTLPLPVLVEGRVLSPDGAPLGRATVRAFAPGPAGGGQLRGQASADASGRFRLVLPAPPP